MAAKSVEKALKETKIYQIINPRLVHATPEITVKDAIDAMQQNGSGYIVIADKNKKVVGIFTETDVVRKVLEQDVDWQKPVKDFMTLDPACLRLTDSVGAAIDLMGDRRFYHIPLVNDNHELVQVISVRTLIRFLAEFYPAEVLNLPPTANQVMETAEGG